MKKILAATLLTSMFAVPALAAVPGGYVALDLQNWSATNTGGGGNPGMGLRIGGGYRFTQNIGVEVNYAQSGNSSNFVGGGNYKVDTIQLAAVGTYPINPMFDVFAKLGVSNNKVSFSSPAACSAGATCNKTDLMFGIGAQYNINQQWGVRLMYEDLGKTTKSVPGGDVGVSTISLGGVYAF